MDNDISTHKSFFIHIFNLDDDRGELTKRLSDATVVLFDIQRGMFRRYVPYTMYNKSWNYWKNFNYYLFNKYLIIVNVLDVSNIENFIDRLWKNTPILTYVWFYESTVTPTISV